MRKFLKRILVLQEVSNKNRKIPIGRGYSNAYRVNPYNPLSYVTIVIGLIVGIVLFGFVGVWKEVDVKNPFKWQ